MAFILAPLEQSALAGYPLHLNFKTTCLQLYRNVGNVGQGICELQRQDIQVWANEAGCAVQEINR